MSDAAKLLLFHNTPHDDGRGFSKVPHDCSRCPSDLLPNKGRVSAKEEANLTETCIRNRHSSKNKMFSIKNKLFQWGGEFKQYFITLQSETF